jgi:NRPS condensation-like uncharacterized protein
MPHSSPKWSKIDNAAKIVPSTTKGTDTRVFRITCVLKEEIDGPILQLALDRAVKEFPYFNCVLRKGLFWYYLDSSNIKAISHEENKPPCAAIYFTGRRNLLYRVVYNGCRINLEMFHVLTDGTGAMEFLKAIVTNYLKIRYNFDDDLVLPVRSSLRSREADAFTKFYEKMEGKPLEDKNAPKKAYHLQGERDENLRVHLLEGTVSTSEFLQAARAHNSTIAIFTTALYMEAIIKEMSQREKKLPIVLSVPVNLRNYFHSETTRNFFGVINVAFYPEHYDGNLQTIIEEVKASFDRQLKDDQVALTMQGYSRLEHNLAVKVVPLFIKDLVISFANSRVQRGITGTVSNVGRVTMPDILVPYIDKFSCFMAAPDCQISISSFGDRLVFGVASAFKTHNVMMNFFRAMTDMEIEVELATNDYDAPEDMGDEFAAQKAREALEERLKEKARAGQEE